MHIGAYVAVPCVDYMTSLHAGHVGLEGPGWLCKLPERLMAHGQLWDTELLVLGVTRHFAKALGDGNVNRWDL